jgi:hypothetical protein
MLYLVKMNTALTEKHQLEIFLLGIGFVNQSNPGAPRSSTWLRHPKRAGQPQNLEERLRIRGNSGDLRIEVCQILDRNGVCPYVRLRTGETSTECNVNDKMGLQAFFSEIGW